jgi:tetratricopeptide (TPR) repeat protein
MQLLEGNSSGSALPKENPYHQHFETIKAQYMAMSLETATKNVDDVLGIMETLRSAGNKRAAIRKGFEAAVQNAGEGRYEDALRIGEQLLKDFSASFDMSRQDVEAMTQIMNFLSDVRRAQIAQSHLAEIEQIEGEIAMLERENRVTDAAGWRLNLASAWAEMGEFEKAQRQTEQAMDTFRQHNATEELENARRMLHVIHAEALLSDLSDDETVKAATDSIIGLSKEQAAYINAAAASRLGNRGEFQLARECAIRARGLFEMLNVAEGVAHTQRIIQRLDEIEGGNADT